MNKNKTINPNKNDVFESSIKKVRIELLKRKTKSNYNSHTRVNNSVVHNKLDLDLIELNDTDNENTIKKNIKVLRPTTSKVMKINDNIKDIEKLDKFQLEIEVP